MNRRRYKEPAPERYQVLEYLESTGTQWIDLGDFTVSNDYGFKVEAEATRIINDFIIAAKEGSRSNSGHLSWSFRSDASQHYVFYGGFEPRINGFELNKKYAVELNYLNDKNVKINNTVYDSISSASRIKTTKGFILFGYNSTRLAPVRIYNALISKSSNIEFNLTPVRRMSDNELGMYDRVSGKFYTNRGTGTFIAGNATGEIIGLPSNLPNGYQEVEYIQSTGTQYIGTDITNNSNRNYLKINAKYIYEGTSTGRLYGITDANANQSYFLGRYNNFAYNKGSDYIALTDYVKIGTNDYSATFNNGNILLQINDGQISARATYSHIVKGMFGIFCRYRVDLKAYAEFESIKLCKFEAFDSETNCILNLIPCYRKSDNKPGMYDVVNNKFYTNNGTGEFLVGPNIDFDCDAPGELGYDNPMKAKFIGYKKVEDILPSAYQEVEYLGSTGTQYIITADITNSAKLNYLRVEALYSIDDTAWGFMYGITNTGKSSSESYYIGSSSLFQYNDGNDRLYLTEYRKEGINKYSATFNNSNISFYLNDGHTTAKAKYNNVCQGLFGIFCRYRVDQRAAADICTGYKMYNFKAFNSETNCILNLIPCYRKSDNKPGMYDVVNNKFYTNQGTGEFIVGNDVVTVDRLWDYKKGIYNPETGEFTKL